MRVSSTGLPCTSTSRAWRSSTRPPPPRMRPSGAATPSHGAWPSRPGPAEHRGDPCLQLARRDGLAHEVVGAGLQAQQQVDLVLAVADEHDVAVARRADAPTDLQAVDVRQGQVEHHEVGLDLVELGQGVRPRAAAETSKPALVRRPPIVSRLTWSSSTTRAGDSSFRPPGRCCSVPCCPVGKGRTDSSPSWGKTGIWEPRYGTYPDLANTVTMVTNC